MREGMEHGQRTAAPRPGPNQSAKGTKMKATYTSTFFEYPTVAGLWEHVAAGLGGFVAFFFMHYVAHRIAHWHFSKILHDAHEGHHIRYSGKDIETEQYVHHKNSNLIDYLVGIPSLVLLFLVLPLRAFLVVGAVTAILGVAVPWIHVSFHVKGHWLNNYRYFRHAKRLHFIHHDNVRVNYSFLLHFFDRLFLTFRSRSARR